MPMESWNESRLGDLITYKKGFAFKSSSFGNKGDLVVRVSDTTDESIDISSCNRIPIDEAKKFDDYRILTGDVIISTVGSWPDNPKSIVGKVIKVPIEANNALLNQNTVRLRAIDKKSQSFIYYRLKCRDFSDYLISGAQGSANQASITLADIFDFQFPLPEGKELEIVSEIFKGLDDKIDLLHRQNKTLEQLAETLFRQWFVEEADESWEVGTVEDLFRLQRGFDLPIQNRIDGKYPIITSSGIGGTHNEFKVNGPGVTTGRSGLLGQVFYIDEDFWPLNTSLFVVEYKIATPLFAYFFLKTMDIASLNGGSAVPTLNRNDVHSIETQLPPKHLVENFETMTNDYFKKIKSNTTQIRTLTQLRDTLLPKLMSGEVRVKM